MCIFPPSFHEFCGSWILRLGHVDLIKSTISLLICGCSLQALESFGVGTYCVRRGKERGSERARERERGENGECFGSPVAVLLKDLMDEQRLTVANFSLG